MKSGVVADKSTPCHAAMGPKGIQGYAKARYVEDVTYSNDVPVKDDFNGSYARYRGVCVVGKGNIFRGKRCIGGEGIVVGPHVVRCSRICDKYRGGRRGGNGGSNVGGMANTGVMDGRNIKGRVVLSFI